MRRPVQRGSTQASQQRPPAPATKLLTVHQRQFHKPLPLGPGELMSQSLKASLPESQCTQNWIICQRLVGSGS